MPHEVLAAVENADDQHPARAHLIGDDMCLVRLESKFPAEFRPNSGRSRRLLGKSDK
jgi:hypothetical protein